MNTTLNLLNTNTSLLLIIDIQEKLLNAQFEREEVAKNSTILASTAKILNIPVVVSEQYPKGLGLTIESIKENLPEDAKFFEKTSFNCCLEDGFINLIKSFDKKQILVCGIESHVCVHQTVSELISLGYEVHLVQDAISSRKEYEYKTGLQRMINYGAIPSCTEMVLFEFLKCTKHPEFKSIQGLIK